MEDSNRKNLFGSLLADDIFVEECTSLDRSWERLELNARALAYFFFNDFIAQLDALIADVHTGAGDQFLDLFLGLAAERALQ
jgi:hypothetical protein